MDLADEAQVTAFLQWVEDTEGSDTAAECQRIVKERLEKNDRFVERRAELVDPARRRAHREKIVKAIELAQSKIDSHLQFGD